MGGEGTHESGWLLLEFVARGRPARHFGRTLGRELARLDRPLEEPYGWESDNYIGSLPQANHTRTRRVEFWRDVRLAPQLDRARSGLLGS